MEIGMGIHGELGVSRVPFTTDKDIVFEMIDIMTDETAEASLKLAHPYDPDTIRDKIALIINKLGGSSQIESGVFAMEVIQQLISRGLNVERVYMGTLMTSLDTSGFQFSVVKLSLDKNLKKYLDAPTAAAAWPKVLDISALGSNWNESSTNMGEAALRQGSETSHGSGISNIEPFGPELNGRTTQVFLIVSTFACKALISCTEQLNIMDEDSGNGDCGTSLAQGANAIKSAIKEKQISGSRPFVTFRQISYIIERVMDGIMRGLYSLFFDAGAKEFAKRSWKDPVDARMWLNALAAGNKAIIEYGQANVGDRTMLDPLLTAQDHLADALEMNLHPIEPLEMRLKQLNPELPRLLKCRHVWAELALSDVRYSESLLRQNHHSYIVSVHDKPSKRKRKRKVPPVRFK